MTDQTEKPWANETRASQHSMRKSTKTAVRLLQGLGVGLVIYFTVPLFLFMLFNIAAKRMFYMNIMCPDEVVFNIDNQNRSILIPQTNIKNEKIEVVSQSDNSLSIKVRSGSNLLKEKDIDFKFEDPPEASTSLSLASSTANRSIALKVTHADLNCLPSNDYDEAAILILLSFIGGATGSIISIFSRIEQYYKEGYEDTELPFYIGLFKPIIGGTFGVFIFTILASGVIQISNPLMAADSSPSSNISIEKWLFFIGISFVGGFSERFAQDIISATEDRLGGDSDAKDEAKDKA